MTLSGACNYPITAKDKVKPNIHKGLEIFHPMRGISTDVARPDPGASIFRGADVLGTG